MFVKKNAIVNILNSTITNTVVLLDRNAYGASIRLQNSRLTGTQGHAVVKDKNNRIEGTLPITVVIENCYFANSVGVRLHSFTPMRLEVRGCTIRNSVCSTIEMFGASDQVGTNTFLFIKSTFVHATKSRCGARSWMFLIFVADITIKSSSFYSGAFLKSGIAFIERSKSSTISSCRFNGNSATEVGAVVFIRVTKALIINSVFSNNRARMGGAVSALNTDHILFANCVFSDNNAVIDQVIFEQTTT